MANLYDEFKTIEEEFFDLDKQNKKAKMKLEFARPSDLFDNNAITKIPVLTDEFLSWVKASFEYCPRGYKIDLDIAFDNLEGYKEEQLKDIFFKNMVLEGKKAAREMSLRNRIALGLTVLGVALLISMILLMSLWQDGGLAKEVVSYVFDIAATVTIWEAMTIWLVQNREQRELTGNLIRKYDSISFHKK